MRTRATVWLIAALLGSVALTGCGRRGAAPPAASTTTTTTGPASTTTTTTVPVSTTVSTAPPTPAALGPYQPLFPFDTAAAVDGWRRGAAAGGHEPWHLDAGQTAVAFARWLGYADVDTATSVRNDRTGAHVGVGFPVEGGPGRTTTAAVVHLVRWGSGPDAPWEVVGTDDTSFSVTAPAYGATVVSPVRVGGRITGVDENIRVEVRSATSSSVVGAACCRPAGGEATPWSVTVSFAAPAGSLLVVSARTGGHLATVERFAVTAVRVRR